MNIDVVEKKDNSFLKRTDLMLTVDHKGQATPKKEDLEKAIAQQFKTESEKVEIIYILSGTGLTKSKVKARLWEEKIVKKEKKEVAKEEEKVEEAPKEQKKEEKKAETKPEEKPKEQPKKEGEKK